MNYMNFILENVTENQSITFFRKSKESSPIICKSCDNSDFFWIESKKQYQCRKCKSRVSLKSGTVMQYSKLPFRIWFIAMVLIAESNKPISANNLKKLLGLKRYQPVWELMHKLRNCMSVSQIQTFKYDLKEYLKCRMKQSYSNNTGKVGLLTRNKLESDGKYSLSIIYENSINRYLNLPNCRKTLARSFHIESRLSLKKTIKIKNKDIPIWTRRYTEFYSDNIRGTYHHIKERYFQNYLDEYCFKLNCNLQQLNRFEMLLNACMSGVWFRKVRLTSSG